jgi:antitoxin VapB
MKTNSLKTTTRTFKSGNSIAVRIPHEFNLEAGKTFEIKRRGRELVLIERAENLGIVVHILQSMPADFFAEGRVDLPPQERDFSAMFDEPVIKTKKKPATKTSSKVMAKKK